MRTGSHFIVANSVNQTFSFLQDVQTVPLTITQVVSTRTAIIFTSVNFPTNAHQVGITTFTKGTGIAILTRVSLLFALVGFDRIRRLL
jgi:hypothetical protein